MKTHGVLLVALLAGLSGCHPLPPIHDASGPSMKWVDYACSDGRTVRAAYPDTDTALVQIGGDIHHLRVAISGNGARYVGEGWQWWTKGMRDGMLAPLAPGEDIASAHGVTCHAG